MNIQLNGKNVELKEEISLKELLSLQKIDRKGVAVAINFQIIHSNQDDEVKVKDRDVVDILTMVSGG